MNLGITLGLVFVAAGFFLNLVKTRDGRSLAPAVLACNLVGWALVLYFGLKLILASRGAHI